ncbi:unnamed protein product [Notodromas monacha]|uniref:Clustered mitochondria protein homolog n=1 Tax=Notodromas monacha TaxID=399045 RepID=A0A7R9GAJ9_9CRUS|nr:unnamed protein product [Notodromas monacha]CAG0915474.1 unnamed protein product [Notodromas monacha]
MGDNTSIFEVGSLPPPEGDPLEFPSAVIPQVARTMPWLPGNVASYLTSSELCLPVLKLRTMLRWNVLSRFMSSQSRFVACHVPTSTSRYSYSVISRRPENEDILGQKLTGAKTEIALLGLVEQHVSVMNNEHLLSVLEQLHAAVRRSSVEVSKDPRFKCLCDRIVSRARFFQVGDLVNVIKALRALRVPSSSPAMTVCLDLLTRLVNDLTLNEICYVNFLLKDLEAVPAVKALRMAFPIVFKHKLDSLAVEDPNQLAVYLKFSVQGNVPSEVVSSILERLRLADLSTLSPQNACHILMSMADSGLDTGGLFKAIVKFLVGIENSEVRPGLLLLTAKKLTAAHDARFFDWACKVAMVEKYSIKQLVFLAESLRSVSHHQVEFADYLCAELVNAISEDGKELDLVDGATALSYFAQINYRPYQVKMLGDFVRSKAIKAADDPAFQRAEGMSTAQLVHLAVNLRILHLDFEDLAAVLLRESSNLEGNLGPRTQMRLLLLRAALGLSGTSSPKGSGKTLKTLLAAAFGQDYVANGVQLENGLWADHLILLSGNVPVSCGGIMKLDAALPGMKVLVSLIPESEVCRNVEVLQGVAALKLELLQGENRVVVPVVKSMFNRLSPKEQIPWLMNAVLGAVELNGCGWFQRLVGVDVKERKGRSVSFYLISWRVSSFSDTGSQNGEEVLPCVVYMWWWTIFLVAVRSIKGEIPNEKEVLAESCGCGAGVVVVVVGAGVAGRAECADTDRVASEARSLSARGLTLLASRSRDHGVKMAPSPPQLSSWHRAGRRRDRVLETRARPWPFRFVPVNDACYILSCCSSAGRNLCVGVFFFRFSVATNRDDFFFVMGKIEDVKMVNEDEDPPAERLPMKTNGASGADSGLDKSDSSESDASSTKSDPDCTKTKEEEKDSDVFFLPEVGFTVKIDAPGTDKFEITVSSMELVQEIHQLLMDREDTCHRTCFSLQLNTQTLDNFAELKSIEGLKEGSVIKVVEEPYTVREARIHVRHVRDLLKCLDPCDAYLGVECTSLSFLSTVTQAEKKKGRLESVDCTPPEFILPGVKDLPILPLLPVCKDSRAPQCLKVLTTSGWNPPPGPRKLHGDLLYVFVVTLEDKRFHITASTRGFFVNQSTDDEFCPKAASPNHLAHSLIELLQQISPGFKRNFGLLQKKRTQRHPFERVATPYQVYTWVAPHVPHSIDALRAEDGKFHQNVSFSFSSKLGYEEHIPGQTRDWNEELQTTRELPRKALPDRLLRERAIFKVHSDFVGAATRGAMAVVDGNVMAINPGEDPKMHMFIWNNIFFSLGFDVRDHYRELGGDAAAHVAPGCDLVGVRVYSAVDVEGLYTLGTVVVDYRGYRVTAQSIIPGILEREQEQSVIYGSIDFGKTVVTNDKYVELLKKAAAQLKILPHKVLNSAGDEFELFSSVECKGIVGNDGRHYILDLLRTFPADVNFLVLEDDEPDESMKAMGFPIELPHKLASLRHELIEAFVETRYVTFIKYAAVHLQQLGLKRELRAEEEATNEEPVEAKVEEDDDEKKETVSDEDKKFVESITDELGKRDKPVVETTKEIVRKAAEVVGSLKQFEFDIRFNPDVYSPGVQHADKAALAKQRRLVKDAAAFLVENQIPGFVRECLEHTLSPSDGFTLVEALHNRGINVRYLGKIAAKLAEEPQLKYVHNIAVTEMISRSAKHIYAPYMQGVEMMSLSSAISLFLNCLLSSCPTPHTPYGDEELQTRNAKKRRNRLRKNQLSEPGAAASDWVQLTPKSLWLRLKQDMKACYAFELQADSVDSAVDKYGFAKVSLLRAFCVKVGVQLLLRDYHLDSRSKQAFHEEDIVNVFPIVKHINPRATDAFNFYSTGQTKIQQGFLKEGYELISEALNLLNSVYGAMHSEIAQCLRMLARLNYIMGDHVEALAYQQKAVMMSERVNGVDHPYTISEYAHMALYCFANSQVSTALKLLYRARYLALMVHGENHPEMGLLDSNIGLILHAVGEYDLSLRFLEKALALNIEYYGVKSLKVAVSYHLVARTQSCMGDFRSALHNEKETYGIYKSQLGDDHEKTRESSECLRHLTQQAVVMQKKMNEMYQVCAVKPTGKVDEAKVDKPPGNHLSLPPIHIQPPTMASVLDMLNVINGILFVQIRLNPASLEKKLEEDVSGLKPKEHNNNQVSLQQEDLALRCKEAS